MSMRILVIFFLLIILLVIGELFYIFLPPSIKNGIAKNIFSPFANPAPVVDITTLDYLKSLPIGIVQSSTLTNEYEGNVVSIDTKGGTVTYFPYKDPIAYKINIQIVGKEGKKTTFYYTESELKILEFLQNSSDKKMPLQISDLHTNDRVIILQELNYLSKPNPIKIKSIVTKF